MDNETRNRLFEEKRLVATNKDKLDKFISKNFDNVSNASLRLLMQQQAIMLLYNEILYRRIDLLLKEENNKEKEGER